MLPRVKIFFENGNLGQNDPSPDGYLGILFSGAAAASGFVLGTPYIITSLAQLATMGITSANNASLMKLFTDFYAEAEDGTPVMLQAHPDTVTMAQLADVNELHGKSIIEAANGKLRGLIITRQPGSGYSPTITNGLDADVTAAITKAQALAEWATLAKFAPIFVAIPGMYYSGDPVALADLKNGSNNRVCILIGDTSINTNGACIGLLAGRIASIPVQRNIGRIKDGAVQSTTVFIKDKAVEKADTASIHDKGYITFRTFTGRSGYFFSDDVMATIASDDYSHLTARRTIDKAYRIAYDTLLELLLDEVPINTDGTLQYAFVKAWQQTVENAISSQMTGNGELSASDADSNDLGVICSIDHRQNIVSTSKLVVKIQVRPFGYGRYIDVYLGFKTTVIQ
jgi:Protein of unknown function (DUF2586)